MPAPWLSDPQVRWANANRATEPQHRDTAVADHAAHLPLADLTNLCRLSDGKKAIACVEAGWQITVRHRVRRYV
jgi:hypothetical protein